MGENSVQYEVRGRKAYVTLNRPAAMNAINREVRESLHEIFASIDRDDDVLVVILAGAGGRAFSAGADLKEMAADGGLTGPSPAGAYPGVPGPGNLLGYDDVDSCAKPVIAAIDGYCLAGGFEPALRIQLTGAPMTAERAHAIGLIQEIADDRHELMRQADVLADELLACAPLAVQYIKRIVKDGRSMPVEQACKFSEMFWASIGNTQDATEGQRAFAEKRKPDWKVR